MERLNENETFISSDLAIVAALSLHFPIEAIDKRNPYKAYFIFQRTEALDRLVKAYYRGEHKEDPIKYFQQLKTIKSRIYSKNE